MRGFAWPRRLAYPKDSRGNPQHGCEPLLREPSNCSERRQQYVPDRSGVTVQLCGDAHLSNFGVFGTPERQMIRNQEGRGSSDLVLPSSNALSRNPPSTTASTWIPVM